MAGVNTHDGVDAGTDLHPVNEQDGTGKEFTGGLIQRDERRDHGADYDENADRDEKTNGPQRIEDWFVIHDCHSIRCHSLLWTNDSARD